MSASVKRNIRALRVLSKAPKKLRDIVLTDADEDLILALCEVIHNVLIGTVKLKPKQIKKLRRYHSTLFNLSQKTTSVRKKRKLLLQKGGFLSTLLPPAIALLSTLLLK
jgi:hypothetical protein